MFNKAEEKILKEFPEVLKRYDRELDMLSKEVPLTTTEQAGFTPFEDVASGTNQSKGLTRVRFDPTAPSIENSEKVILNEETRTFINGSDKYDPNEEYKRDNAAFSAILVVAAVLTIIIAIALSVYYCCKFINF